MKRFLLLVSISTLLLSACGGESETTNNTDGREKKITEANKTEKMQRGTIEEIAKTFVKAMINADKNILKEVYNNPKDPLEYMLPEEGPFFAETNIDDYEIEITNNDEGEVRVARKDEVGPTYWMTVEMIGKDYYITDF